MLKKILLLFIVLCFSDLCYGAPDIPAKYKLENWISNTKWLIQNKKYDKALEAIDRALQLAPDSSELKDLKTEILIKQKEFFKIDYRYELKKSILNPVPVEERFQTFGQKIYTIRSEEKKMLALSEYYLKENNLKIAQEYIDKALKINSKFAQAYFLMGKIYMFDNPEISLSYFKRAFYINQSPENILYLAFMATKLKKIDFLKTLILSFDKKYSNTDLGAYLRIFSERSELDEKLLKEFDKQKVDRIEFLDMPSKLSIDFYNKEFIIDSLIKILEKKIKKDWLFYYINGFLYSSFLRIDESFINYSESLRLCSIYHKDHIQDMVEKYRDKSKIVLDPNSFEALWMKAQNFYKNGNYKKSIEQIRKAMLKTEEREPLYLLLGLDYFKIGDYENAKKNLTSALEKIKDDPELYYAFGEIYFLERNYYEALKYYQEALKINPEDKRAIYKSGKIYSEQSDYDKALNNMNKVVSLDENYIEAYIVMGNIYTKTNRFDEAIDSFSKVLEIDEKYLDAYISLSIVYFKKWEISSQNSMLDSAIEVLERAKELSPDNEMVKQYLEYYYQQKAGG